MHYVQIVKKPMLITCIKLTNVIEKSFTGKIINDFQKRHHYSTIVLLLYMISYIIFYIQFEIK